MTKTRLITCVVSAEVPAEVAVDEWRDYVQDAVGTMRGARHPYADPIFDLDSETVRVKKLRVLRGKKLPPREYDYDRDGM